MSSVEVASSGKAVEIVQCSVIALTEIVKTHMDGVDVQLLIKRGMPVGSKFQPIFKIFSNSPPQSCIKFSPP